MEPTPVEKSSVGAVIAIIVIVVLLILGAFYVWSRGETVEQPNPIDTSMRNEATTTPSTDEELMDEIRLDDISVDIEQI